MPRNTDLPVISKILVAVDGSVISSSAAENAIVLAEKFRADLIALYIVPPNIKIKYLIWQNNMDRKSLMK